MRGELPAGHSLSLEPARDALLKNERRTRIWRTTLDDGTRAVIKLYRERGRRSDLRSRVLRYRVEREYRRLRHLTRWGIPCTPPVGWGHGRSPEHGVHEFLVMEEVPDAIQLQTYLEGPGTGRELGPLLEHVRRMHESGLCSQTLFATNVLVRPSAAPEARFYLSDLPRSWTFPGSIAGSPMAWYDLLDLTWSILDSGVRLDDIPLEAYGLGARGRRWWAERAPAGSDGSGGAPDSRAKSTRLLRDAVARVRWAAAWGLPHRTRRPPG